MPVLIIVWEERLASAGSLDISTQFSICGSAALTTRPLPLYSAFGRSGLIPSAIRWSLCLLKISRQGSRGFSKGDLLIKIRDLDITCIIFNQDKWWIKRWLQSQAPSPYIKPPLILQFNSQPLQKERKWLNLEAQGICYRRQLRNCGVNPVQLNQPSLF